MIKSAVLETSLKVTYYNVSVLFFFFFASAWIRFVDVQWHVASVVYTLGEEFKKIKEEL